jgi:hypothetical protein
MKKISMSALAITAALALVGCGTISSSSDPTNTTNRQAQIVTNASGVLELSFPFGVNGAKVIVGPAQGRVEVFGLPGVADGTVYNGISAINWKSGTGDDNVQFEVTQAQDFDITVDTGTSNADVQAKWIIPAGASATITPSFSLSTGPGMKKVSVDLESFTRDVNFALTGRMGAGDTEFKSGLQFKQGGLNAAATVDWQFGASSNNKAELIVDNEARNLDLNLSPRLMSELVTKIVSDDPADRARVRFNPINPAGGGKIGFEMTSRAPSINLDYDVRGGAGMDDVNLSLITIDPASITSNVQLDLGQGNDKLEVKYDGQASNTNVFTGAFALGGGDDEAKLEFRGLTNYGFGLDCGEGTDKAIGFRVNAVNCELN